MCASGMGFGLIGMSFGKSSNSFGPAGWTRRASLSWSSWNVRNGRRSRALRGACCGMRMRAAFTPWLRRAECSTSCERFYKEIFQGADGGGVFVEHRVGGENFLADLRAAGFVGGDADREVGVVVDRVGDAVAH